MSYSECESKVNWNIREKICSSPKNRNHNILHFISARERQSINMAKTRTAAARDASILADDVVRSYEPTRARKSSRRGNGVIKNRAPFRVSKASRQKSARTDGRVSIDQAIHRAARDMRSRTLQPNQNSDHRHGSPNEHRDCCPQDFPDIDFHQSFGLSLTRKNPISETVDPDVAKF